MMTRAAQITSLEAEFKKEMADLYLLLRNDAVAPEKKVIMKSRLNELENVLLSELDEVKGNTEIRRRDLRKEVERETRRRLQG
jgi:hypothetical protein